MKYFFIILYLTTVSIFAEISENWKEKEVLIGEEAVFTLKFDRPEEIKDIVIPEQGFYPKDADLPGAEIENVSKSDHEIVIIIRFLEAGDRTAPLEWTDPSGKKVKASSIIKVKTSLEGTEKSVLDISSPREFSGNFVRNLLLVFLAVTAVLGAVSYFAFRRRLKAKTAKDADFDFIQKEEISFKDKIQELLKQQEVQHKEFIYLLTGFIKESLGKKLDKNLVYLDETELGRIMREMKLLKEFEIMQMETYFQSVKYMPNEDLIPVRKADEIYYYWKHKI